MIRTLAVLCAISAAPVWPTPAPAATLAATPATTPAPRVLPRHDVTVTYQVSGAAADAIPVLGTPGSPTELRLVWSAGQNRLLVLPTGRPQRLLVDLPGHQATVLDDGMRVALQLPMRDVDVQALTMANARFTRRGQETVAGEACTDWAVESGRSRGTVCLTEDGVPLRGEGDVNGRHGAFVATVIDHNRVDPSGLSVPAGYNRLELPRFGGH